MDTKIITAQAVPLNNREPDTPMAVFEKMKSIIKSCKTLEQIDNCRDLHTVYRLRFPEYSKFAYRLLYTHNAYHHRLLTDYCYDALKGIRKYSPAEMQCKLIITTYKVTIKEVNKDHVLNTSITTDQDLNYVRSHFGLEDANVEWYTIEKENEVQK